MDLSDDATLLQSIQLFQTGSVIANSTLSGLKRWEVHGVSFDVNYSIVWFRCLQLANSNASIGSLYQTRPTNLDILFPTIMKHQLFSLLFFVFLGVAPIPYMYRRPF